MVCCYFSASCCCVRSQVLIYRPHFDSETHWAQLLSEKWRDKGRLLIFSYWMWASDQWYINGLIIELYLKCLTWMQGSCPWSVNAIPQVQFTPRMLRTCPTSDSENWHLIISFALSETRSALRSIPRHFVPGENFGWRLHAWLRPGDALEFTSRHCHAANSVTVLGSKLDDRLDFHMDGLPSSLAW